LKFKIQTFLLDNSIGIAINQCYSNVTLPLTSYYFWPKTDAWRLIQLELETKIWLLESEKVAVLNEVTGILNNWRKNKN
jgi:30S ribosomal protein 3